MLEITLILLIIGVVIIEVPGNPPWEILEEVEDGEVKIVKFIYNILLVNNIIYIFISYKLYNISGGNDPDPWESGPSSRGGNWGGPSTSAWDNSFSDGYQQSFGAGPIRGSNGPLRGGGAARPGPYNSNT